MTKSVHFNSHNIIFYYSCESDFRDTDFIRESNHRKRVEEYLIKYPTSELEQIKQLIALWRNKDISIVLGNLGRQPYLLNYYLDLCFGPEEIIKVICDWNISMDYQSESEKDADFLFRVEPYFGYTVHKDPSVKHLIILTSHLSLCCWGDKIKPNYLYLSNMDISRLPDPHLQPTGSFKPLIFHEQIYDRNLPDKVLLDVSDSKTAHEAYLRLLTGRDIIGKKSYVIYMKERHKTIIRKNIKSWIVDTDPYPWILKNRFLYNWLGID